jgi:hypothetical protein
MERGLSRMPLSKASEVFWVNNYALHSVCHIPHKLSPDRRSVNWDPSKPLDPTIFRRTARPGDFELESLQLEDVLITVYQPGNFRPYTASIFRADLRCFRKQWTFYDFLSAENVVGQFDNCLFSLHKPQSIGRTTEKDIMDGEWARMVGKRNLFFFSPLSGHLTAPTVPYQD